MTTYLRPLLAWLFMLGGWALVVAGVFGGLITVGIIERQDFVGAIIAAVVSVFFFRGGIQILKIGVAARICLQARADTEKMKSQPLRPRTHDRHDPSADW